MNGSGSSAGRPTSGGDASAPKTGPVGQRIWNPAFTGIFIANSLMSIGLQMGNILIGKYTNSLGATATLVGVVSSAFAWAAIVFKLISGPALDALNRKHVIIGALAVTATAFVGCGLSSTVPALLFFRLMEGAGLAFTTTAFIAMAADALPREKTSTGLGFYALAAGIAQMIGPVVSLNVSERYGYRPAFFIAAAFVGLSIVAVSRIKLEYRQVTRFKIRLDKIIAPEVLISAVIMVLLFSCYSLIDPFLPIHAQARGIGADISFFFTVYAVMLMVTRPAAGWLADRFGYLVLVPMFGLFFASFWVISVATELWMFLLAGAIFACGYGGCQPVMQSLAMRLVPSARRGAASSTNFVGSDLGKIIGPIIGGSIADTLGFTSMWQIMSVTILVAAVIVIVFRRKIVRDISRASMA